MRRASARRALLVRCRRCTADARKTNGPPGKVHKRRVRRQEMLYLADGGPEEDMERTGRIRRDQTPRQCCQLEQRGHVARATGGGSTTKPMGDEADDGTKQGTTSPTVVGSAVGVQPVFMWGLDAGGITQQISKSVQAVQKSSQDESPGVSGQGEYAQPAAHPLGPPKSFAGPFAISPWACLDSRGWCKGVGRAVLA